MAHLTFQQEYLRMPPITRAYTTACIFTTMLVQLDFVSPFQLYYNPILIFKHYQVWRLLTTFLFFGTIGFTFLFNMLFIYRYCRMLEEGSFRGRPADFLYMMMIGMVLMLVCARLWSLLFLGQAFTMMIIYVWARRNPFVRMNFFGLLNFQAPYLPWALLGFSVLLGNPVLVDVVGMAVGHIYYFLEDVFPRRSGGIRILKTPRILTDLFEPTNEDPAFNPPPEERPGGFQWGEQVQQQQQQQQQEQQQQQQQQQQ